MIRYLTRIENTYNPKNRLEQQILDYLKTQQRQLIPASRLEFYKDYITNTLEAISSQHPRCKRIRLEWWSPNKYDDTEEYHTWRLSINNHQVCTFALYAGEEVEI